MNWAEQWELFAPNFKKGKAHIDLTPYGSPSTLQLYAGPGFGDHSHPTTRLVLRLMPPYIQGQSVVDIGCGSGILSFAAAALGAASVYGYDIDPEAVAHARKNLSLSPHADKITFSEQPPKLSNPVFLMNMISSEQAEAWTPVHSLLITSGILTEDEPYYLSWRKSQGCKLLKSLREDGWSGFIFAILSKNI